MAYRYDEDRWMEIAVEQYQEWIENNYTFLEIEDGDVKSFDKWLDERLNEVPDYQDEDSYEETYA